MSDSHSIDAAALLSDTQFLRRLATRLVGADAADDVTQEVLAAATGPGAPADVDRRWLAGVTRRIAAMKRRGDARRQRRETFAAREDHVASTDELVQRAEMQRVLTDAVNDLPDTLRDVIVLRFFEDLAPRAVAKRLEIPVNTVRSRTRRAVADLRSRLDAQHGDRRTWVSALLPLTLPRATAAVPLLLAVSQPTRVAAAALVVFALAAGGFWAFGGGPEPLPNFEQGSAVTAVLGDAADGDRTGTEPAVREAVATESERVRGSVVDMQGQPVEGAVVYYGSRTWQEVRRRNEPAAAKHREASSAGDGEFSLPMPADVGLQFHGGGFELGAPFHDRYVAERESTEWQLGDVPEITMRRLLDAQLEVEVVDVDGEPVQLCYLMIGNYWNRDPETQQVRAHYNARREPVYGGRYRADITSVEDVQLDVRVEVPGLGPGEYGSRVIPTEQYLRKVDVAAGDVVKVRFEMDLQAAERQAAETTRGRVLDAATDQPIAGARLLMQSGGGWFSESKTSRLNQSGEDGRFRIARPKDGGRAVLRVEHEYYQHVEVAAATDDVGDVRLTRRGSFACTVVDADGDPIARMPYLFRTHERGTHERGFTDDEGRVAHDRLADGRYHLYLLSDPMDADESAIESASFSVEAGVDLDETVVVAALDRFPVRGIVLAPFAEPVVPAFVPLGGTGGWVRSELRGHNNFDAGGMRAGRYLVALVPADDGARDVPPAFLAPIAIDGFAARSLELTWPSGTVEGSVVIPGGSEVEGLRIVAIPQLPQAAGPARTLVQSAEFAQRFGVPVAADGSFRVEHVADGPIELQLRRGAKVLDRHVATDGGPTRLGTWEVRR